MRIFRKYYWFIVLMGVASGVLNAVTIMQGNLSDGTPYFYTVSDSYIQEKEEAKETKQDETNPYSGYSGNNAEADSLAEAERIAAEEKRKAELEAKEAEEELLSVLKQYNQLKIQCEERINTLKAIQKTSQIEAEYIKKDIENQSYLMILEYQKLQDSSDRMVTAYEALGDIYKKYEYAGDPVQISTGDYICEYVDYEAMDYLDGFKIYRNYQYGIKGESFGDNWSCSLDSRIIRCNYDDFTNACNIIDDELKLLEISKAIFSYYVKRYYISYPNKSVKDAVDEIAIDYQKASELKELYENYRHIQTELFEKNRYVTYGRYSDPKNYAGNENILKYLDEYGTEHIFLKDDDGKWKSAGKLSEKNIVLEERLDGIYLLRFSDGRIRQYTDCGILQEEIDVNGNVTQYSNKNGKINSVILKTGETLTIERDNSGKITNIKGRFSGETKYFYAGNNLVSVMDNSGVRVVFDYDSNNMLSKITKADNEVVNISYSYNQKLEKYVCSRVQRDSLPPEKFEWNFSQNKMIHTTSDGKEELYYFNSDGYPTLIKDFAGNCIEFEFNQDNLISVVRENGCHNKFFYDEERRLIVINSDKSGENYINYDSNGSIRQISNSDGDVNSFEYDAQGNITDVFYNGNNIAHYRYYQNGLIKAKTEPEKITEYSYNNFGRITSEIIIYSDGKERRHVYEYDSNGRLIQITDGGGGICKIKNDDHKTTETYNRRKIIERVYDERNKEKRVVITDIESEKSYVKEIFYDVFGNINRVLLDGEIYEEKEFSKNNQLVSYTVWNLTDKNSLTKKQGIKTEYVYGKYGILVNEKQSVINYSDVNRNYDSTGKLACMPVESVFVNKNVISDSGNNIVIHSKDVFGVEGTYFYDKAGRLVRYERSDGFYQIWIYSKSGKLLEIRDSNYNQIHYSYKKDGSYVVTEIDEKRNKNTAEYNKYGLLMISKNSLGFEKEFFYDSENKLIKEICNLYEKNFAYDYYGRLVSYTVTDNLDSRTYILTRVYDDELGTVQVFENGVLQQFYKMDVWNRPVEIINNGEKKFYQYDVLNQLKVETNETGEFKRFEYDPLGNIAYVLFEDGSEESYLHSIYGYVTEYCRNNQISFSSYLNPQSKCLSVNDVTGARIERMFDTQGYTIEETVSGTGKNIYRWSNNHLELGIIDSRNNEHFYRFDSNKNVIYERNILGKEAEYEYDVSGRLVKRCNFDGRTDIFIYEDRANVLAIEYGTGEKAEIHKNGLGLITRLKNDLTDYSYSYDDFGNLILAVDNESSIEVSYSYDCYGRCIGKKSDGFDFEYFYNNNQCVKIIDRLSGAWVTFAYDLRGKEIERNYSNGCSTKTVYNASGFVVSKVTENGLGKILKADFVVYDRHNRISVVCDEKGNWKKYNYDEIGRLRSCVYPYSEELETFNYQEALDSGINIKERISGGSSMSLDTVLLSTLNTTINNAGVGGIVTVNRSISAWKEEFAYDVCGNVSELKNEYGSILYEYDEFNRLIAKYGNNSRSSGQFFNWNENGCLSQIKGRYFCVDFEYGALNRPVRIISVNYESEETKVLEYSYDALGRRVRESINGDDCFVSVYDGFSLEVIQCLPVMKNMNSVMSFVRVGGVNNPNNNSSKAFERNNEVRPYDGGYREKEIRWIEDAEYLPNENYRYLEGSNYRENSSRTGLMVSEKRKKVRVEREERPYSVMYFAGLPVVKLSVDSTYACGIESEFIVSDYRGEIVNVSDSDSVSLSENTYDVWGNLLNGNRLVSYGYSGLVLGSEMLFYNSGFRDYCPSLRMFTTIDPVRDGRNWFGYCITDPVNQFDINGLTIMKTVSYDYMTNYDESVLLGNSKTDTVKKSGCYITTFANQIQTLKEINSTVYNEDYDTVTKINNEKKFFVENETDGSLLKKTETMNELFGENNWDYYTKSVSGTPVIKAILSKLENSKEEFLVSCVFDLSEVKDGLSNHMVALNENFNSDGYLDNADSITGSSENDNVRINNGNLDAYNLKNVKEIRFVKTEQNSCNK